MKPIFRLLSLFILPALVAILTLIYFKSQEARVLLIEDTGEKILSIPYQSTLYEDFGMIYTPTANLAVKNLDGFEIYNFLVDTGAIVSAVPAKKTQTLGINLAYLPRIAVEGYGGQTTFTYRGTFTVKIMEDLVTLPCVFSEVDTSNYILGRKGLFENYSLNFSATKKAVEFIRKI